MKQKDTLSKVLVSAVALGAALLHIATPYKLDNIVLILLSIALLPWLAAVLRRAELPGGLKFEFQEIKAEQARQARELDAIKFLIGNFLTAPEQDHLEKIASKTPFLVRANKTSSFFATELRKLRSLGFIKQIGEEGVRNLLKEDGKERNVCDFFEITSRGREYIQLRTEMNNLSSNQPSSKLMP
jgi:hypothetical protein